MSLKGLEHMSTFPLCKYNLNWKIGHIVNFQVMKIIATKFVIDYPFNCLYLFAPVRKGRAHIYLHFRSPSCFLSPCSAHGDCCNSTWGCVLEIFQKQWVKEQWMYSQLSKIKCPEVTWYCFSASSTLPRSRKTEVW